MLVLFSHSARHAMATVAVLALTLVGCGTFPKDPEQTLDRIRGRTMRVGYTVNEPWVRSADGEPEGVEVRIVKMFARTQDANIEWIAGSEQELFSALESGQLDLVVGGIVSTNAWSSNAAFTHPYLTTRVVVGVPASRPLPDDVAGMEVAVERGTEAAGVLEKTDAIPVLVDELDRAKGPAVVDDWLLDDLGLRHSGVTLIESDHVMAVPRGENDFMITLERFLLKRHAEIERILDEEGRP